VHETGNAPPAASAARFLRVDDGKIGAPILSLVQTMLRHFRPFLVIPLLAVGCIQDPQYVIPELKGHVVDQAANPVGRALVKLIRIEGGGNASVPIDYTETNGNGEFAFSEAHLEDSSPFVNVVSKWGYEPDAQDVQIGISPKKRDVFVLKELAKK
jgi:hypothetical protein